MGKIVSKFCFCFGRYKVLLPDDVLRQETDIIETTQSVEQITPSTISTCADFDELKNSLKYYLVYRNGKNR